MQTDSNSTFICHETSGLPLFDFRAAVVFPSTRAGIHLTRRYRISLSIADVIAELAGLGEGSARR